MNDDGGLPFLPQMAEGLMDEKGNFRLDHSILEKHYRKLVADEAEAVAYLLKAFKKWNIGDYSYELSETHLKLDVELPEDSSMAARLGGEPSYRLAAIFPPTHPLYELAVGYNALANSEQTREISLTIVEQTLILYWQFGPDSAFEGALRKLLRRPL